MAKELILFNYSLSSFWVASKVLATVFKPSARSESSGTTVLELLS